MALTNLAVFGGAFFTPILVGKITHTIGWEWSFYLVAIFCGVCLPLVIFFVPETAFRRSDYLNIDMASSDDVRVYDKRAETGQPKAEPGVESVTTDATNTPEQQLTAAPPRPIYENGINPNIRKYTYWETLAPFNGLKTDENFFKLLLRPFPLFAHPGILWACLVQGTMIGWTVSESNYYITVLTLI